MTADAGQRMDRMYRYTRHVYDATRKVYLLGRDRLFDGLRLRPGERVCEVGCGTARNLVRLARRRPDVEVFGVDASGLMLATARTSLRRHALEGRVRLAHATAQELDPLALFGLRQGFDHVVFSYSLSMMPDWQAAIDRGLAALAPGGSLHVVDFGDQAGLPAWFRRALRAWLALFAVHARPEVAAYLATLAAAGRGAYTREVVARGYAWVLRFCPSGGPPPSASQVRHIVPGEPPR